MLFCDSCSNSAPGSPSRPTLPTLMTKDPSCSSLCNVSAVESCWQSISQLESIRLRHISAWWCKSLPVWGVQTSRWMDW
eukprot:11840873-Ditylum_brightwellii.AAC.1